MSKMLTEVFMRIKIAGRNVLHQALVNIGNFFKLHILFDLVKKSDKNARVTSRSAQVPKIGRAHSPINVHIGGVTITLVSRHYALVKLSHPMNLRQDSIRENKTDLIFHEKYVIMTLRQGTTKLYTVCKTINSFGINQRVKHVLDLWKLRRENPFSSNVLCLLRQQGNLATVDLLKAKNARNELFIQANEQIESNSFHLMIAHSTMMDIFTCALPGDRNTVVMDESEITNIHYVVVGSEPPVERGLSKLRMKGHDFLALQLTLDENEIWNNNNPLRKDGSPLLNIKVGSNEVYGPCAFFTWSVRETYDQVQWNLIHTDLLLLLFQLICTLRVLTTARQIYVRMVKHAINSSHNQVHSISYFSDIISHTDNYEKLRLNVYKCQSCQARNRHSGHNVS